MDTGIVLSWATLIGSMVLGVYAAFFVADALFYCFAAGFCYVDGILQERHWRKIQSQITSKDVDRVRKYLEDAA